MPPRRRQRGEDFKYAGRPNLNAIQSMGERAETYLAYSLPLQRDIALNEIEWLNIEGQHTWDRAKALERQVATLRAALTELGGTEVQDSEPPRGVAAWPLRRG